MKILFLTNTLDIGGVEVNLVRLTAELRRRGRDVLVASRPGPLVTDVSRLGATHVSLDLRLNRVRCTAVDLRTLRRVLRLEQPDVVHFFSASTALLARLAGFLVLDGVVSGKRRAIVGTIMGLKDTPWQGVVHTYARAYGTTIGAHRVIVVAPAIKRVVRRLPVRQQRIAYQPILAVDVSEHTEAVDEAAKRLREALGVPPSGALVTTIGRLDETKSHDLFIQAAANIAKKRGDVRFVIVGVGPLEGRLARLAKDLGLENVLTFLGLRKDVDQILVATDVYVRPGIVEGGPGTTVLEAQARCVPVVAFETEDVKVAITHGKTGWLVPLGDTKALAEAINELLESPELATRLGESGRTEVASRFSVTSVVDGLEQLYRDQLGRRR